MAPSKRYKDNKGHKGRESRSGEYDADGDRIRTYSQTVEGKLVLDPDGALDSLGGKVNTYKYSKYYKKYIRSPKGEFDKNGNKIEPKRPGSSGGTSSLSSQLAAARINDPPPYVPSTEGRALTREQQAQLDSEDAAYGRRIALGEAEYPPSFDGGRWQNDLRVNDPATGRIIVPEFRGANPNLVPSYNTSAGPAWDKPTGLTPLGGPAGFREGGMWGELRRRNPQTPTPEPPSSDSSPERQRKGHKRGPSDLSFKSSSSDSQPAFFPMTESLELAAKKNAAAKAAVRDESPSKKRSTRDESPSKKRSSNRDGKRAAEFSSSSAEKSERPKRTDSEPQSKSKGKEREKTEKPKSGKSSGAEDKKKRRRHRSRSRDRKSDTDDSLYRRD